MYEFCYDYLKPKYYDYEKTNLCYMDKDGFTVYIKTDDIYEDIAEAVETRFDTSNSELARSLPKGKKSKSNYINERKIRRKNHDKIC